MAQVWLSYDELASFFDVPVALAEAEVAVSGWSLRKSRDGVTRIKLPTKVAYDFMVHAVSRDGMTESRQHPPAAYRLHA